MNIKHLSVLFNYTYKIHLVLSPVNPGFEPPAQNKKGDEKLREETPPLWGGWVGIEQAAAEHKKRQM